MLNIFKRKPGTIPRKPVTIEGIILMAILIIVGIQALGVLIPALNIKLGPVFQIILIAATVVVAFAFAKKQIQGGQISRADIGVLVVLVLITILAMIFMKQYIPSIFREGLNNMQSMLNMR